jgi:hypothetical protein
MSPAWFRSLDPVELLVVLVAGVLALAGATDHAGSFNDGSRLATVEALVDYHTFAIDDSIYVNVPLSNNPKLLTPLAAAIRAGLLASPAGDGPLAVISTRIPTGQQPYGGILTLAGGTGDKIYVNGHYYSDKPAVPAVYLAWCYLVLQRTTGLVARENTHRFCRGMTLGSSGLAYLAAVWCIYRLGLRLRLSWWLRLALAASFGLCTVAMPYMRNVNSHIWLLAIAAGLMLNLAGLAEELTLGWRPWWRLVVIGLLAGLGYAVEGGAGPLLFACTLTLVAYRCGTGWGTEPAQAEGVARLVQAAQRGMAPVAVCLLAALPWLVLHHVINYDIAGTWKPAGAVAEYFDYPGSAFNAEDLTGSWHHAGLLDFLYYCGGLLVGDVGFLQFNLPLFLALPALAVLVVRRGRPAPEVLYAAAWSGGTFLMYAMLSTNYAGWCCSIRWFVPLLAPAYYGLALFLRSQARYRVDFLVLSIWGGVLAAFLWDGGAWGGAFNAAVERPYFWPVQAAALLSWMACWVVRRRSESGKSAIA